MVAVETMGCNKERLGIEGNRGVDKQGAGYDMSDGTGVIHILERTDSPSHRFSVDLFLPFRQIGPDPICRFIG